MKYFFNLLRMKQWYKNIIIFVPLVFSLNLFNKGILLEYIIGFISMCAVSSSYYIVNDIIDRERDKLHPEKKERPLAAGKISLGAAVTCCLIMLALALLTASYINYKFFLTIGGMFVYIVAYSLFLKEEAFLDMILIAFNFVLRTLAGIFILNVNFISPWIISCTFFLAMLIVAGKRKAELMTLKQRAGEHRKVLEEYTPQVLEGIMYISASFLLVAFSIYAVLSEREGLLISLPVVMYSFARYFLAVQKNSVEARNPEFFLKDKKLMTSILVWIMIVVIALY